MLSRDIGLIGYGNSIYEKRATRTEYSYLAEAARGALASAGVDKSEIDGLAISSTTLPPDNAATAAEYLGLALSWANVSTAGGAGPSVLLRCFGHTATQRRQPLGLQPTDKEYQQNPSHS